MEAAVFYNEQWANLGDFIRYNPGARHRRRIVRRILRRVEFGTLLDVGCGPGEMMVWLRSAFPNVSTLHGVDVAEETVESNRGRFPWASFGRLDIERERMPAAFDLVVCSEVVEHLHHRPAALRNLAAMVKDGGHLLVTCPTGRMFPTEMRFGHISHPTADELSSLGTDNGLETVHCEQWGWPVYAMTKRLTNLWPNWAVQQFANGSYSPTKRLVSSTLYLLNFANLSKAALGCQLFWLYRKPKAAPSM